MRCCAAPSHDEASLGRVAPRLEVAKRAALDVRVAPGHVNSVDIDALLKHDSRDELQALIGLDEQSLEVGHVLQAHSLDGGELVAAELKDLDLGALGQGGDAVLMRKCCSGQPRAARSEPAGDQARGTG